MVPKNLRFCATLRTLCYQSINGYNPSLASTISTAPAYMIRLMSLRSNGKKVQVDRGDYCLCADDLRICILARADSTGVIGVDS